MVVATKIVAMKLSVIIIESGASMKGWGLNCNDQRTGGDWTEDEGNLLYIGSNLKAALFVLQMFCSDYRDVHICLTILQ